MEVWVINRIRLFGWMVCGLVLCFGSYQRLLATSLTFDIHESPSPVYPMDFSVGFGYAYIVFRTLTPGHQEEIHRKHGDVVLAVYNLPTGNEVARVELTSLWGDYGFSAGSVPPRVEVVSHSSGVIVQADDSGAGTFVADIKPFGEVSMHRRFENSKAISVDRYRNLTLVHTTEKVMLLNDQFELEYEWSPGRRLPFLLMAESAGKEILVLDGAKGEDDEGMHRLSGTVRWLTPDERVVERTSIELPTTLTYYPPPRLLVWPEQISLMVHDGSDWQHCVLRTGESEFVCASAAWQRDVRGLHELVAWSGYRNIVRSGADGYVVAAANGCNIWSRRYDLSDDISRYQPSFPSGDSDLDIVSEVVVKYQQGQLFALIAGSRISGGDDTIDHLMLRTVDLSDSVPIGDDCSEFWNNIGSVNQ